MVRWGAVLCLSAALSGAPFQCASDPDPSQAMEETPGQALYDLAAQFKKKGDERAWRNTLEYLIEHYPGSHYAEAAKHDLEGEPEAPPGGPTSGPSTGPPSRTAVSP